MFQVCWSSFNLFQFKMKIISPGTRKERRPGFLIDTPSCRIIDWPIFDPDVLALFENQTNMHINCSIANKLVQARRVNFTGIVIEKFTNKSVKCVSMGVRRDEGTDNGIHYVNQSEMDISKVNYFADEIAVKVNCSIEQGI